MKKSKFVLINIIFLIHIISCEDSSKLIAPTLPQTGEADFSKFISLGNSLTAGFQNGALYESAQKYSFGNLIAEQVGTQYIQPTINDPGIGGRIEIVSLNPFTTQSRQLLEGLPNNSTYEGIYNNLGIPGAVLEDLLNASGALTAVNNSNLFFEIILRDRGTVIQQFKDFKPTIATLWIGNNDILGFGTSGGKSQYTPEDIFAVLYDKLCDSLSQGDINIVVANIPNVSAIPFFTTIAPSVGAKLQNAKIDNPNINGLVFETSNAPFISIASIEDLQKNRILLTLQSSYAEEFIGDTEGSYYSSNNIPIPEGINTSFPFGLSERNPFPNNFVLDLTEQNIIENVISSYNATILNVSEKYGLHLVDIHGFFNKIASDGILVEGVEFTTEFVFGGLFSLDGIHLTNQGSAIIANKFIEVMNEKFSADIPFAKVTSLPGSIELGGEISFSKKSFQIFDKNALY